MCDVGRWEDVTDAKDTKEVGLAGSGSSGDVTVPSNSPSVNNDDAMGKGSEM